MAKINQNNQNNGDNDNIENKLNTNEYINEKDTLYLCFYCHKETNIDELSKVEELMMELDCETHELILDELSISENPINYPYSHTSQNLEYDVLNICEKCYTEAWKKYESGSN